jgi:hypothetical protein
MAPTPNVTVNDPPSTSAPPPVVMTRSRSKAPQSTSTTTTLKPAGPKARPKTKPTGAAPASTTTSSRLPPDNTHKQPAPPGSQAGPSRNTIANASLRPTTNNGLPGATRKEKSAISIALSAVNPSILPPSSSPAQSHGWPRKSPTSSPSSDPDTPVFPVKKQRVDKGKKRAIDLPRIDENMADAYMPPPPPPTRPVIHQTRNPTPSFPSLSRSRQQTTPRLPRLHRSSYSRESQHRSSPPATIYAPSSPGTERYVFTPEQLDDLLEDAVARAGYNVAALPNHEAGESPPPLFLALPCPAPFPFIPCFTG